MRLCNEGWHVGESGDERSLTPLSAATMSEKFNAKQIKEFKEAYSTVIAILGRCKPDRYGLPGIYDEDADGKLDSDACCRALRACGIPLTEGVIAVSLAQLFQAVDDA